MGCFLSSNTCSADVQAVDTGLKKGWESGEGQSPKERVDTSACSYPNQRITPPVSGRLFKEKPKKQETKVDQARAKQSYPTLSCWFGVFHERSSRKRMIGNCWMMKSCCVGGWDFNWSICGIQAQVARHRARKMPKGLRQGRSPRRFGEKHVDQRWVIWSSQEKAKGKPEREDPNWAVWVGVRRQSFYVFLFFGTWWSKEKKSRQKRTSQQSRLSFFLSTTEHVAECLPMSRNLAKYHSHLMAQSCVLPLHIRVSFPGVVSFHMPWREPS